MALNECLPDPLEVCSATPPALFGGLFVLEFAYSFQSTFTSRRAKKRAVESLLYVSTPRLGLLLLTMCESFREKGSAGLESLLGEVCAVRGRGDCTRYRWCLVIHRSPGRQKVVSTETTNTDTVSFIIHNR